MRLSTRFALIAALASAPVLANSQIIIHNVNDPGVGFNDPTPATPVGGNPGTTIGEQRLIAFQYAATVWGASLKSTVPIVIDASFTPLQCDATSAVLGAAAPNARESDFTGAPQSNTWYPVALANSKAGTDLDTRESDIVANFNSNLGNTGCLTGNGWYLGLDNNAPAGSVNLGTVLMHEFGHGLGFLTFVDSNTGLNTGGIPDVFERNLLDDTTGKLWSAMSNTERLSASVNPENEAWQGAQVTAKVSGTLNPKLVFNVDTPAGIAGVKQYGYAEFGPLPTALAAPVVLERAKDQQSGDPYGCGTMNAVAPGDYVMVDRGPGLPDAGTACSFVEKVKNAQNAGAAGVVVGDIDPVDTEPKITMAGTDKTITIPAIILGTPDSDALRNAYANSSVVTVDFHNDTAHYQGADDNGKALVFTPSSFQAGSSISHWSMSADPPLLMQPYIHDNTPQGLDFTYSYMQDIGWDTYGPVSLGMTKIDLDTVNPGGQARYLMVVVNHSNAALNNVVVNATVPTGLTFVSNEGACTSGFPCTFATLPADSSTAFVATYSVPSDMATSGTVVETASMTVNGASDPDYNATWTASVGAASDLQITATAPGSGKAGATVQLSATITNAGPSNATGVTVTAPAASGVTLASFSGDCSGTTCSLGDMAVGATKHVTATFNIDGAAAGNVKPALTVGSSGTDPQNANDTASASVTIDGGSSGGGGCTAPGTAAALPLALLAIAAFLRRARRA
jgi:uncharacterized repeat protein (TIGR01451 family)